MVLRGLGAAAVVVFVPVLVDHRFDWVNTVGLGIVMTGLGVWAWWPYLVRRR
jgi:hypothetical protein